MEIKVKKQVEEIHNIELPYYSKTSAHFFKIIRKDLVLKVVDLNADYCGIELSLYCVDSAIEATPCTEQEFNEAFNRINKCLTLINQVNETNT